MYTYEQAHKESLEYFNNDKLPTDVFLNKYCLKDNYDNFYELTPDDMHWRMAMEFAHADSKYKNVAVPMTAFLHLRTLDYHDAFEDFARLVPQGSPMAAVGNKFQILSASNCVVIESPEDSIDGIMNTASELAQLYKRRCGVGVDISKLRPNRTPVNNAARKTTGPCSFANHYSDVTRLIGQDGRRGALMITISVHHPDVEEFAAMKADQTKVTGANVSVRLTDEFMRAVANDENYEQRWPIEGEPKIRKMVSARKVWNTIIKYATETADPGLQFWDTACRFLPAHQYERFRTRTSNPCSEIFLSAYDACRLLSINLTGYVRDAFEDTCGFDLEAFKDDVHLAMRTLDNLVDIELELTEKIIAATDSPREKEIWRKLHESGRRGRRTGLGTHGLADTLAQLRIKYDSEESLKKCEEIYKTLRNEAYRASVNLAKERGAFPDFDWETHSKCEFIQALPEDIKEDIKKHGIRNISLLTNAPTGTTSLISKCGEFNTRNISSGIEPVFRLWYTRKKKINPNDQGSRVDYVDALGDRWQEYKIYHGNLKNYMDKFPGAEIPDYFVTSDQIDWKYRVKLQGVIQKYIDHSISSTINLPRGTKPETVGEIYLNAWKYGLKGVTVYVEGSKDGVLVSNEVDTTKRPNEVVRMEAPTRPKKLPCRIFRPTVRGKKWIVLVGLLDNEPYEIFCGHYEDVAPCTDTEGVIVKATKGRYNLITHDGKSVHEDIIDRFKNPEYGWATRLVSCSLRHGTPIEFLVEQLSKDGKINDFNKVMARVLKKYIKDGKIRSSLTCSECDSDNLEWKDGCPLCLECGNYKCG